MDSKPVAGDEGVCVYEILKVTHARGISSQSKRFYVCSCEGVRVVVCCFACLLWDGCCLLWDIWVWGVGVYMCVGEWVRVCVGTLTWCSLVRLNNDSSSQWMPSER